MTLRLIMLGDIVGGPGRRAVTQLLPQLRERFKPHLVIANGENVANGTGITPDLYRKLCDAGIDGITLGDHVYKKKQIIRTLETESNIIRPANLPAAAKGRRWMQLDPPAPPDAPDRGAGGDLPPVFVVTVLGRIFMSLPIDEPFATIERVLAELPRKDPIVIVEAHCEATSEKIAMGWHLDGRVSAVLGSHTHVLTADERVLPGGTAYITDMGMCGPMTSVIGRDVDNVLFHMTTSMHAPFDVPEGDPRVHGVYIEIDENSRRATHIERIAEKADVSKPPFTAG